MNLYEYAIKFRYRNSGYVRHLQRPAMAPNVRKPPARLAPGGMGSNGSDLEEDCSHKNVAETKT